MAYGDSDEMGEMGGWGGGTTGTTDPGVGGEGDGFSQDDMGFLESIGFSPQDIIGFLGTTIAGALMPGIGSAVGLAKDLYQGYTEDRPQAIEDLMRETGMTKEQATNYHNRETTRTNALPGSWGQGSPGDFTNNALRGAGTKFDAANLGREDLGRIRTLHQQQGPKFWKSLYDANPENAEAIYKAVFPDGSENLSTYLNEYGIEATPPEDTGGTTGEPPKSGYQNAWETYNPGVSYPYGPTGNNMAQPNALTRTTFDQTGNLHNNAQSPESQGWGGGVYQPMTDIYESSMADITKAENEAEQVLKQALSTGRGDIDTALQQVSQAMQPYAEAGQAALKSVMGMLESGAPSMEEFRNSRTYQFPLEEMTRNMQRTAAVKGKFLDPSTMNAINDRAQDYASQRWQQFRDEEYWRPMGVKMDIAGRGQQASGRIADASQWAGGSKAGMEMQTGNALAANRQWGSGLRTGTGQNYMQNILQKGGQGIDWYNAGEGQRERDWTEDVGMPWAEKQSNVAMDFYNRQRKSNQQNSIWSDIIGGGFNWLANR